MCLDSRHVAIGASHLPTPHVCGGHEVDDALEVGPAIHERLERKSGDRRDDVISAHEELHHADSTTEDRQKAGILCVQDLIRCSDGPVGGSCIDPARVETGDPASEDH